MTGPLVMVGVSHTHAPQELLESVAVRQPDLPSFLEGLRERGYGEAVVLSTCSRTELYAVCRPEQSDTSGLIDLLATHARLPRAALESVVEVRNGAAVVDHLFSVTAGLESRGVGEADVQAQVRRALQWTQSISFRSPRNRTAGFLFGSLWSLRTSPM